MAPSINVSAWSIRHNIGPITLSVRNETGEVEWIQVTEGEPNVALANLPHHIKTTFDADGMEIPDWYLMQASEEERSAFKQALEAEGMNLVNVTIDFRAVATRDPKLRGEDLTDIERVLDYAGSVGAKAARVNISVPPILPATKPVDFDDIVSALKRLAAYGKARNVRLMIENHCEYTDTIQKVVNLLDAVGPDLGLILDTGNIEPIQGSVIEGFMTKTPAKFVSDIDFPLTFVSQLAPLASIIHIKTYGLDENGVPLVYDQAKAIDVVSKSDFDGPISIECASFDPAKVYPAIEHTVSSLRSALARSE